MEFEPDFPEKLDQLDDQVEDLFLDLMNLADVTFVDKKQFEQSKDFIKTKLNKALLKLLPLMKSYEIHDKDINE